MEPRFRTRDFASKFNFSLCSDASLKKPKVIATSVLRLPPSSGPLSHMDHGGWNLHEVDILNSSYRSGI